MERKATFLGVFTLIPRGVPETSPGTIADPPFGSNRKPILDITFSQACFRVMTPGRYPAMGG